MTGSDRLASLRGIDAVLFDMDGTVVDSEHLTREVVEALMQERGLGPSGIPDEGLHGVTWAQIAADLVAAWPDLAARCSGDDLHARCHRRWLATPPPAMPGIVAALAAASEAGLAVALATSAHGEAADVLLAREGFVGRFDARVSADDIERSKPDPEIFLVAASRLGVLPGRCLVFEDSLAGLRAAAAAGMDSVGVLLRTADRARARALATATVTDFTDLPAGFFSSIRGPRGASA